MSQTLNFPPPSEGVAKIAATLSKRLDGEFTLPSFSHFSKTTRDAARRFWSNRAWTEYAALPMISQVALRLAAEGAPLEELSAATGILQDESLHTALSVQVAEAFGGYVEDIPDYLQLEVAALSQPSSMPLSVWLVVGGCIGETLSRALIQARLKVTTEPTLKALTARTLRDENVHVAFAWAAAKRAVASLPRQSRNALAPWCAQALRGAFCGPSTLNIQGRGQHIERKLRLRVSEAGLGSCTPEDEDRAIRACIKGFILPGLRKMGISLQAQGEGLEG